MALEDDLAESREFEMKTYLSSMEDMYANSVLQNGEVYDIAAELTDSFRNVSGSAILADSRIIKTLRYAVAPTISQMKFGQFFGMSSIGTYENARIDPNSTTYARLAKISDQIAEFANANLDRSRFIWLDDPGSACELAMSYAKKWTCSIAADANAQTAYRNWRKDLQEQRIVAQLIEERYVKSQFQGIIENATDIAIGEYTQELRVQGRTRQKADVVYRDKASHRLVLVEAKAVGVELDATKRAKECCDKANDWGSSAALTNPEVVAVIAGFFNAGNIRNLEASGIRIVWEHRLSDLVAS